MICLSPIGQRLRFWRMQRGFSQLELALRADTTARHLSFIETGRSRPGRDLVMRLARAMDLPIRERNALLVAAGLPPEHPERGLDHQPMRPFQRAVQAILDRHDPYPATALDVYGAVVMTNAAAKMLYPEAEGMTPEALLDAFLAPGPRRTAIENFGEVAWAYADRLQSEAARSNDPRQIALAQRAQAHLRDVSRPEAPANDAVLELRLRLGDHVIRTFSTIMRFDTALDVTLSELRVELVFPMDETGERFFRSLITP